MVIPENVVNEEQHILSFLVTEVLSDGQSSQGDTGTGAGRFVHLSVHQRHLRGLVLEGDDSGLNHFMVQVVTLAGTFTDTGKHGVTTVGLGDIIDQFHDQYGLPDTGTTEQTDLTSLGIGGKQVDDLLEGHC